jgi:superfamily I DNA/RNA helicase
MCWSMSVRFRPHCVTSVCAQSPHGRGIAQDTNKHQFEVVRMLTQHTGQLTLVGDDDQCIYNFQVITDPRSCFTFPITDWAAYQGSDERIINSLDEHFEGKLKPAQVLLEQNFRCSKVITDSAAALIAVHPPALNTSPVLTHRPCADESESGKEDHPDREPRRKEKPAHRMREQSQ